MCDPALEVNVDLSRWMCPFAVGPFFIAEQELKRLMAEHSKRDAQVEKQLEKKKARWEGLHFFCLFV